MPNDNGISSRPHSQMKSMWSSLTLALSCFRVFAKMEKTYSCKCPHALECWISYNTTMMLPILEYGPPSMLIRLNTHGKDYTKMLKTM